ncbi:MAG: MotA/TolQ/ExbB proton channel family protein [Bacteroidales bacterium]|nr:MotA/TolQ/ExbB proton channel family protein [Candidatus Cacconaster equifaecalis]MCQ2151881.1 MotA/TolQ/ExbB proton channel family protein [Bacteroidales bacterium]
MKKIFMFLAVIGILAVSAEFQQANAKAVAPVVPDTEEVNPFDAPQESQPMHQAIKKIFIEGGATFMSLILVCLVFGLAIVIERILTLSLAQQNSKKLAAKVEEKLKAGDIDGALDICRDTRGPVASIYYQGLLRVKEGQDIENIEKSVVSYGSVQMGQLESGMSWIALFIGIAPMLGFMGTVLGLIQAFDAIEVAGDISPALVAGGMKVALITTVGGLVVAIILQIFYNYLVSKIDGVVVDMENASIDLVDLLVKYRK